MSEDLLERLGIDLIPEPQEITVREGAFRPGSALVIVLSDTADGEDRFAAEELAKALKAAHGINATVASQTAEGQATVHLIRREGADLKPEGYRLSIEPTCVTLEGHDAAGLFWGTQTLLQVFRTGAHGLNIPCMVVDDWPDIRRRAMHYDTKHHQDTCEYVQDFIRTLAGYKVNMLVWEWEDKFAYERHPEIGAPGAFTKSQMQDLTRFARQYHVQIVPLVQGLGHVSYILKHPQHRHLREIANSAWEFCPLNEGSYELLFDLWDEAMEATPGSDFLHIGSDETYELGLGEACGCKGKADEIGRDGLMHLFLEKAGNHVAGRGRQAMCWYWPYRPDAERQAPRGLLYVDNREIEYLTASQERDYDVFSYAPNPGIEPLFLSYLPWIQHSMWRDGAGRRHKGSFRDTAESLSEAGKAGITLGSMTTSWDDSGLHNQAWAPRFVCAAEYSWSCKGPELDTWIDRFMRQYFGAASRNMRELFQILQESAIFYYDTFQRRVWHWGDIGKIHIPDFPRQELEYHPFWRRRYAQLLNRAEVEKQRIARALWIIDDNLPRGPKHRDDLEIYRTCADLMRHNVDLVLMLGALEEAVGAASKLHFSDRSESLAQLDAAREMIEAHLSDRKAVFERLVSVWERARLPKGYATPEKPYVFSPDRARHFANRTPDMRYLILDEELLDLEGYLERLKAYIGEYRLRSEGL